MHLQMDYFLVYIQDTINPLTSYFTVENITTTFDLTVSLYYSSHQVEVHKI